jgi:excisionase family DNA binding protein
MRKIISLEVVAKLLGVSGRTVVRLVENGELTGFKVGRSWKFDEADVDAYIQRQKERARGSSSTDEVK